MPEKYSPQRERLKRFGDTQTSPKFQLRFGLLVLNNKYFYATCPFKNRLNRKNVYRCDYEDNGKGLQIDVDKILDSTKDEVNNAKKASCYLWKRTGGPHLIRNFGEVF